MYLRDDKILYASNGASGAESAAPAPRKGIRGIGAAVNRKGAPKFVAPASPREALREFPRRVDALVHSIIAHSVGELFQMMRNDFIFYYGR